MQMYIYSYIQHLTLSTLQNKIKSWSPWPIGNKILSAELWNEPPLLAQAIFKHICPACDISFEKQWYISKGRHENLKNDMLPWFITRLLRHYHVSYSKYIQIISLLYFKTIYLQTIKIKAIFSFSIKLITIYIHIFIPF